MNSRSEKLTNRVPKGLYWADGSNFIPERMPKGLISNSDDTADLDTSVLQECLNCQPEPEIVAHDAGDNLSW